MPAPALLCSPEPGSQAAGELAHPGPAEAGLYARVAVGRPVRGEFTYLVPEALKEGLAPGRRMVVPFGRAKAVGYYLGPAEKPPPVFPRPIIALLDQGPVLPPDLLELLRWTADYYRYPLGETIRTALPPDLGVAAEVRAFRPNQIEYVQLSEAGRSAPVRGPAANAIVDYLKTCGRVTFDELSAALPGAREPLRRLAQKGVVQIEAVPVEPLHPETALAGTIPRTLTEDQQTALSAVKAALGTRQFSPFLLHGVTGSGKTEVYLRAIAAALEGGRAALCLVPEIALTPQLVGRFRARFGEKVAVLHSGLKDAQRYAEWQRLMRGEAPIAVGVRSAIFAPVKDLGILVVDEEHDGSFKQEEKLRYNARDLSLVRGRLAKCPVILGSATPSLETLHNVELGRYRKLVLRSRIEDRPMPEVKVIDLRLHGPPPGSMATQGARAFRPREVAEAEAASPSTSPSEERTDAEEAGEPSLLSPELATALGEVLRQGKQAILFLNRRGHSTFLVCSVCGYSMRCPNCAVALTHHLSRRGMLCHYCAYLAPLPEHCPECRGEMLHLGLGTERVEAEVMRRFPEARVARLDRDVAESSEKVTSVLAAFARADKDVLIGTQMVAKGHDFPGVTLVGVVLADTALNLPDFRAAERTFQLLAQVAGRAGRGSEPGRVFVQSFNPETDAVAKVVGHNFDSFAAEELRRRKVLGYPPFSRLLAVRIEGLHPERTAEAARQAGEIAGEVVRRSRGALRLLGPAPAPLSKLRGRTRWQMLVKGPTPKSLVPVAEALERAEKSVPAGVRVSLDVDPVSML